MKKMITVIVGTVLASTVAMAQGAQLSKPKEGGPCSNYAKYGAMKLFRTANQASGGDLNLAAFLTKSEGQILTYSVNIDEGVNDGADDGWLSATYIVKVRALDAKGAMCKVVSVEEVQNP